MTEARFLTGPTMGHVVRMTMTGAAGISFVFIVDAANLLWISQLGDLRLVAAIGYSFAIQFFSVSIGVGMMIAATALISRQIGQGDPAGARRSATSAMVLTVAVQTAVAALIVAFRHDFVALAGATGETAEYAARYLAMTIPSLPAMAVGLVAIAALRAAGDGRRAMYVTLTSGAVSMVLDPVFILGLGWGLDGAALVLVLFRIVMAGMALRYAIGTHDLMARPAAADVRRAARPFAAIALPAILTQSAAPFGNYLLTSVMAQFGDAAMAGWAVIGRLTEVAFGGIFALSGAVGGIFGQNCGAGLFARLRSTYRDALIFAGLYSLSAWAVLFALTWPIARAFELDAQAARVLAAFTTVGAGAFIFGGALFVANAAFNTLGRPERATAITWLRDGVLAWPAAIWLSGVWQASGVIYAQAGIGALAGIAAALWGWRFVASLGRETAPAIDRTTRRAYRDVNRFRRR